MFLKWAWSGSREQFLHCGLRKFRHSKPLVDRWYTRLDRRRFVYDTYKTMKVTRTVECTCAHRPTLILQLHDFDLFKTCRTALLRGNWQDFNWHDASRGPSAIAELLIYRDFLATLMLMLTTTFTRMSLHMSFCPTVYTISLWVFLITKMLLWLLFDDFNLMYVEHGEWFRFVSFQSLILLETLDLSYNMLKEVPLISSLAWNSLTSLDLSNNFLISLQGFVFHMYLYFL